MKTLRRNVFITNEAEPVVQNINQFLGGGSVLKRLMASNMNVNTLRTNDLLRKDEWKELDAALVDIATVRLRPLEILRGRGLVRPLDGLGVLLSQYEQLSDMTAAEVSMSAVARTQEDKVEFTLNSVPIPVISKDFRIDIRRLLASRRMGEGVDTTQVRVAGRKVAEKMVDMLFNGYSGNLDGNTLKGLMNATNANTYAGSDWGTNTNVHTDILAAMTVLQGDYFFGPYGMFVANDQYLQMLTYIASSDQTVLQRALAIPQISFIEPADQLTAGTAVMFQLTQDVIDLAIAQDITNVEWDAQGGLVAHFKVMSAYAPRPKSDADGKSGIVTFSGI